MPAKNIEERTVSANPSVVAWPKDTDAMTLRFRNEAVKAASRISGDESRLNIFIEVLDILKLHFVARCAAQKEDNLNREEQDRQRMLEQQRRTMDEKRISIRSKEEHVQVLRQEISQIEATIVDPGP